jgi:hypothetical protein
MGVYGVSNFENDSALDWIDEFLEKPTDSKLTNALNGAWPEMNESQIVLGAAEAVSARLGHPALDLPIMLMEWCASCRKPPSDNLVALASTRVQNIITASALRSEWEAADLKEWEALQQNLLSRLAASWSPYPRKVIPKHSKVIFLARQRGEMFPVSSFRFDRLKPDSFEVQLRTGVVMVGIDLSEGLTEDDYLELGKVLNRHETIKLRLFTTSIHRQAEVTKPGLAPFSVSEALKYFANCRHLRLEHVLSDATQSLSAMPRLESLHVFSSNVPSGTNFFQDIPELTKLSLAYLELEDIDKIPMLSKLQLLSIESLKLARLPSCSRLTNLQSVRLIHPGTVKNLSGLAEAPRLQRLIVSAESYSEVNDFQPFLAHSSLKEFTCIDSRSNPGFANRVKEFIGLPEPDWQEWKGL